MMDCFFLCILCFVLQILSAVGGCPQGWSSNGGHCYRLSDEQLSFADAQRACEASGSSLTSIHNAAEHRFIKGLRIGTDQMWIGFNDRIREGRFVWVDGTPNDYTDWPRGQPNDAGTGEDCGEIRHDGRFNDVPCSTANRYVCKKAVDLQPPIITGCPSDIRATTELGTSGTSVNWVEPTATDNGQDALALIRSHGPNEVFTIGSTVVAYVFRDSAENTAACSFTITVTVVDTTPPTIIGCPSGIDEITELGTNGTMVNWTDPTSVDLSGTPVRIQSHEPPTFFSLGTTEVIYTFADTSNNSVVCTFIVNIDTVDTVPPTIHNCPSDIASINGRHIRWKEPSVFDISHDVTEWRSHSPGIFALHSTDIAYIFTDSSNNVAYCNFTINVVYDLMPPEIIKCPSDITVTATTSTTPVLWTGPYAIDDNNRAILIYSSHTSGDQFPIGSTSVVYIFADDSYNTASCNFSVTVRQVNIQPPVIHGCPQDIWLFSKFFNGSTVTWTEPTSNSSLIAQTHYPGDWFYGGSTSIIYFFSNSYNIWATCTFNVHIETPSAPNTSVQHYEPEFSPTVINCPVDIVKFAELGTSEIPINWIPPRALNQYGFVAELRHASHRPGESFLSGSTTDVTYIFGESPGDSVECNFSVTVKAVDTRPPTIDYCPDDITQEINIGVSSASVSWEEPRAYDASGNVTVSAKSRIPKQFSPLRDTVVLYIFEHPSGNQASCQFVVSFQLVDTLPPVVKTCPDDIFASMEPDAPGAAIWWPEPLVTDNSGVVTTTSSHPSGHVFLNGTTDVRYLFEDESLNRAECNFTVHVQLVERNAPQLFGCPSDIQKTVGLGKFKINVSWTEPTANGSSGRIPLLIRTHTPGSHFGIGTTTVTYVFADSLKTMVTCNFNVEVTIVDATPPIIFNCPDVISATTEIGTSLPQKIKMQSGVAVFWNAPFAIDDSGMIVSNYSSHSPGDIFGIGATNVSYQFRDTSGNTAECGFKVIVVEVDTTLPKIVYCPEDIAQTIELGTYETAVFWAEPVASDNSGNASLVQQNRLSGDYFNYGKTEVTYVFADGSDNRASCVFYVSVSVVDTSPPIVWNCPSDLERTTEIGSSGVRVRWNDPSASDESGRISDVNVSHRPGDHFTVGVTSVTYMFTDRSNNTAVCNFDVTITGEDTTKPDITGCPSDIHKTTEVGTSPIHVSWESPVVSDNSGETILLRSSHKHGGWFDIGTTLVSYQYGDRANNTASCEFVVVVTQVDTTPPAITYCPDDITTITLDDSLGSVVTWIEPQAYDRSKTVQLFLQTHRPETFFGIGTAIVTYIFRDSANNMVKCSFSVTVKAANNTKTPLVIKTATAAGATAKDTEHRNRYVLSSQLQNGANDGMSIAGFALSMVVILVIVVVACLILFFVCLRRRKKSLDELPDIGLSNSSLQKSTTSNL